MLLSGDRLGCFNLSMDGHANCVSYVKSFGLPTLVLGGGGYTMRNVARTWAYETGVLVGQDMSRTLPYNEYYEYYAPDFELNVRSSNMENSNSREYLEKITAAVIDNLRNTGPVPSVQMQDVPRKPFGGMTDEEEAELDDLDEDENKDVRMTEHRWDKQVENGAEFEPSDDDELARANGATRQSSNKRTFTDFGKDTEEEDAANSVEATDGKAAEANPEDSHDVNDDTIEDIGATEQEKEPAAETSVEKADNDKTDGDGDVGMTDSAPAEEEAKIKEEELETENASAPEAAGTATAEPEKPAEEPNAKQDETNASKDTEKPAGDEESKAEKAETADKEEQPADAMDVDGDKEKEDEAKVTEAAS